MHELGITQNILDIAVRHAEQAGASQVTDIYLVVGRLSSVLDDSIQFYWNMIAEGTVAEHAMLHFERLPAILCCNTCQHEYELTSDFLCPQCGGSDSQVVAGDEFYMDSIEVEGILDEQARGRS